MHNRALDNDEAHASPGAGLVVCVVLWSRPAVLVHPRAVRAYQYAIAHFHGAESYGRQKVAERRVSVGHKTLLAGFTGRRFCWTRTTVRKTTPGDTPMAGVRHVRVLSLWEHVDAPPGRCYIAAIPAIIADAAFIHS